MARRRIVVGVVVLAAVAIAVVLLLWSRRNGDEHAAASDPTGAHGGLAVHDLKAAGGLPAWLAQRGAGMRRVAGVVMHDGAPVAGATVRLASDAAAAGLFAEPKLVTDASGRFDFGPQLAMAITVVAEAPRVTGAWLTVDLRSPDEHPEEVVMLLHDCEASIYGTVRDSSGGAIARAHVARVQGIDGPGTDAGDDGSYELCLAPGRSNIGVRADGYGRIADELMAFGRVHRDYDLSPEATLTGRVVRASDRSPVAGALVEISSEEYRENEGYLAHHVSTDADGMFHVESLEPGTYGIVATADRLSSARTTHAIAEIGTAHETITCALVPTLSISGKAIDRESHTPMPGVAIAMTSRTRESFEAVAQTDGSFVIDGVLPGEYEPTVEPYDRDAPKYPTVKVATADITGVTIEIDRLGSISGRVTRDGKPVEGAEVEARGPSERSVRSEHDGRFTLPFLKDGAYHVYAQSDRLGAFTNGPAVTLAHDEKKTGVEVPLDLDASIAGTVVDQNDAPVAGAVVQFALLRGDDSGTATTGDDGSFAARALSGGGDYIFEIRPDESSPFKYVAADGKRFAPIRVRDGKSHVTGIRLKVRVEKQNISGRVVDASGAAAPDVRVGVVAKRTYNTSFIASATTDAAGAFTLRGLAPDTYDLVATSPGVSEHVEKIAAGRSDVVIHLSASGGIDGTVEGFADDVEITVSRFRDYHSQYANVSGTTFELRRVPVGDYNVIARSSNGYGTASVTVAAGVNAKVALHFLGFGTVDGTIVDDSTKTPVVGLRCDGEGQDGPTESVTDATGAFRLERVPAGESFVTCFGPAGFASSHVTVAAGETAHVEMKLRKRPPHRTHIGMSVDVQLGEVIVKTIAPGGPADRAGVAVGDIVIKVGDEAASQSSVASQIEAAGVGANVPLVLERGGRQFTVTVTVEAAP